MTPRNWRMRIEDMLEAIQKIESHTAGMTYDSFVADLKTTEAVLWNFALLGEAASHVPGEVLDRYPALPWPKMRGMRNVLIHDYPRINLRIVWDTVRSDLPPLVPKLREILEQEP